MRQIANTVLKVLNITHYIYSTMNTELTGLSQSIFPGLIRNYIVLGPPRIEKIGSGTLPPLV